MKFGPVPPKGVPQQDSTKVLKIASRWQRAVDAHNRWAEPAKRCVDMFEGRQWTAAEIAKLTSQRRPALKFNVIAPLVRLILGYHRSHKTDIVYKPGQDAVSSEQMSEVLTRVEKAISHFSAQEFVDTEVFLDGLVASRGFFDTRLDFEDNDLGEIKTKALDPFNVKLDPDADTYDINNSSSYICTDRWVSLDEIGGAFGDGVADLIKPFTMGQTPLAPLSTFIVDNEITPVRSFGLREDMQNEWWDQFYAMSGDFVDTYRKTIRLIETQYKIREMRNVFVDLETGDRQVIPVEWDNDRIQKCLDWAQSIGNPLRVFNRSVERIHFTILAGDLMLYDAPSLYDDFTITGYFPYFRRGMTRGMVEDLIDPQLEKNKRRNAEIEIVSKTANGGWMYHEKSLDPDQERKLQQFGAQPGVQIKYKGDPSQKPEIIEPSGAALKHERLEKAADADIRTISGVNESALGELDRVQSGRAIEARQRQAVLAVQIYMDNFKRSKELLGNVRLGMIQKHYTEQRFFRVLGDDGKFSQMIINEIQQDPNSDPVARILNDVTVGKYVTDIDDAPLSATFLEAQFDEMMDIITKMGPAIGPSLPMFADLIMDASSLPRKQEWIDRFKQLMQKQQEAAAPPPQPGGPNPQASGPPPGPGGPPQGPPPHAPAQVTHQPG